MLRSALQVSRSLPECEQTLDELGSRSLLVPVDVPTRGQHPFAIGSKYQDMHSPQGIVAGGKGNAMCKLIFGLNDYIRP